MTLAERPRSSCRPAFTGLWVQSFEHDDAIEEIAQLAARTTGPWPPGTSTAGSA